MKNQKNGGRSMRKERIAGACRQCAVVMLVAAIAACTEEMPAEAPAVAELLQPVIEKAQTKTRAVAENAALKASDGRQDSNKAEMVSAAFDTGLDGIDSTFPDGSAETGFGQTVLAELGLAEAPADVETVDAGSQEDSEPPAAADPAGSGAPPSSGINGNGMTVYTVSADPQPAALSQPGPNALSDEQDFAAVSSRETIESDAARRRLQAANRKVFEPADLPQRESEANVAHYALSTSHEVGSKVYDRPGTFFASFKFDERCAGFSDDYAAQQAFLDAGGPLVDKLRIDPDGDGFACGWTPDIFRSMLN